MKVVGFNGSPRGDGNTAGLMRRVLAVLMDEGIETELVQIGGERFRGCTACGTCFKNRDGRCVFDDDPLNECVAKMREADGMLLGSPTYFANVSTEMKALIDRAGFVGMANGRLYRRKIGAAVVAVRRAGSLLVFDAINRFFLINEMIVPGSIYWNMGIGLRPGDIETDEEGLRIMQKLGENMAWLMKQIMRR